MKRIILALAIVATGLAASAATVNWKITAGNMYAADGTTKYTGEFNLYASGGDLSEAVLVYTLASVANGTVANQSFSTIDTLTVGQSYDFYYVISDSGKALTSDTKSGAALATGATSLHFGNQATYTQAAGNWQSVPEPTSGLLLLLGMAGLALKRKRA